MTLATSGRVSLRLRCRLRLELLDARGNLRAGAALVAHAHGFPDQRPQAEGAGAGINHINFAAGEGVARNTGRLVRPAQAVREKEADDLVVLVCERLAEHVHEHAGADLARCGELAAHGQTREEFRGKEIHAVAVFLLVEADRQRHDGDAEARGLLLGDIGSAVDYNLYHAFVSPLRGRGPGAPSGRASGAVSRPSPRDNRPILAVYGF